MAINSMPKGLLDDYEKENKNQTGMIDSIFAKHGYSAFDSSMDYTQNIDIAEGATRDYGAEARQAQAFAQYRAGNLNGQGDSPLSQPENAGDTAKQILDDNYNGLLNYGGATANKQLTDADMKAIDSDPYLSTVDNMYDITGRQEQEKDASGGGYGTNLFKGIKSNTASTIGGQSDFVSSQLGTDGSIGTALNRYAAENARARDYTWRDILNKPGTYFKDPSGFTYDLGGLIGSSGTMMAETAAIGAALPASVTGALTGAVGTAIARLGIPWLGKVIFKNGVSGELTKKGKALITNLASTPVEAASEGGNSWRELMYDDEGNMIPNADRNAAQRAALTDAGLNMAILSFSNSLETLGLGKAMELAGGKKKVTGLLKGAIWDALQNGWEEGAQNTAQEYSTGKRDDISAIPNPLAWSDESKTQALIGALTGGVQGGAFSALGLNGGNAEEGAANGNGTNTPPGASGVKLSADNVRTSAEFPEAQKAILDGDTANPIERMRNLQGKIPYKASDGTNCMRTIGLAYAGTPYENVINVDEAVSIAKQNGQYHETGSGYVPKPGDIAIVNGGNHAVMVTENGGTIQNGQSRNGVYESDATPEEMFGGDVAYISPGEVAGGNANAATANGMQGSTETEATGAAATGHFSDREALAALIEQNGDDGQNIYDDIELGNEVSSIILKRDAASAGELVNRMIDDGTWTGRMPARGQDDSAPGETGKAQEQQPVPPAAQRPAAGAAPGAAAQNIEAQGTRAAEGILNGTKAPTRTAARTEKGTVRFTPFDNSANGAAPWKRGNAGQTQQGRPDTQGAAQTLTPQAENAQQEQQPQEAAPNGEQKKGQPSQSFIGLVERMDSGDEEARVAIERNHAKQETIEEARRIIRERNEAAATEAQEQQAQENAMPNGATTMPENAQAQAAAAGLPAQTVRDLNSGAAQNPTAMQPTAGQSAPISAATQNAGSESLQTKGATNNAGNEQDKVSSDKDAVSEKGTDTQDENGKGEKREAENQQQEVSGQNKNAAEKSASLSKEDEETLALLNKAADKSRKSRAANKRMERISGDFSRGYTRAIIDISDELVNVQSILRNYHKKLTPNFVHDALRLFWEHRENFREKGDGFIRWNTKKQGLEYFSPSEKNKERMVRLPGDFFSGDFISGYTRAITDIRDELVSVQDILRDSHKKLTPNFVHDALRLFLEHRENFREKGDGFIWWSAKKQKLEYFSLFEEERKEEKEAIKEIRAGVNQNSDNREPIDTMHKAVQSYLKGLITAGEAERKIRETWNDFKAQFEPFDEAAAQPTMQKMEETQSFIERHEKAKGADENSTAQKKPGAKSPARNTNKKSDNIKAIKGIRAVVNDFMKGKISLDDAERKVKGIWYGFGELFDEFDEGIAAPVRRQGEEALKYMRQNLFARPALINKEAVKNVPQPVIDIINRLPEAREEKLPKANEKKAEAKDEPWRTYKYDNSLTPGENMKRADAAIQAYYDAHGGKEACMTSNDESPERKALRAQIVDELYAKGAEKRKHDRQAFIIMGLPGAGKSTISTPIVKEYGALMITADEAKAKLPEFRMSDGLLSDVVHEESSNIANKLRDKAMESGDNIVFETVGKKYESVKKRIDIFKKNGYTVHILLLDLPVEKAKERAVARFSVDGRYIGMDFLDDIALLPRETYDKIKTYKGVTDYAEYDSDVPKGRPARIRLQLSTYKGPSEISGFGLLGRDGGRLGVRDVREGKGGKSEEQTIEKKYRPEKQDGISLPENGGKVFGNSEEEARREMEAALGIKRLSADNAEKAEDSAEEPAAEEKAGEEKATGIDALLAIGKRWTKGKHDRVYFNADMLGLHVSRYNSGNISGASIDGETISNAEAGRLLYGKCFYDLNSGDLEFKNGGERLYNRFKDKIDAAIEAFKAGGEAEATGAATDRKTANSKEATKKRKLPNVGERIEEASDETVSAVNYALGDMTDEELDAEIDAMKKGLKEALRKSRHRLNANPIFDPDIYTPALKLGMLYLRKGARSFAQWSGQVADAVGEGVKPWLDSVWQSINAWPQNQKFDSKTLAAITKHVGYQVESNGASSFDDIYASFEKDYGKGAARHYRGMLEAAYIGVSEFMNGKLAAGGAGVVKSKEENGKAGERSVKENVDNGEGIQGVAEGELPEGLPGDERGRDAGRIREADAGGREGVLPEPGGVVQGTQPEPERGRLPGNGEVALGGGSVREGNDKRDGVREGDLTPAQKKDAPASEHPGHNYTITADSRTGEGGEKTKFKNNVEAIRLLKKLEAENRKATPQEQSILAKYVGWGGLAAVFASDGKAGSKWAGEYNELRELLTDEEWRAAVGSTKNAHYTSPEVITQLWNAVERLGFKGGSVLEPAMGTGNFFGLMPEKLRSSAKTSLVGVELDSLTARIAGQLYQGAAVQHAGFEKTNLPSNFDLAISNVPFGAYKLYDNAKDYGRTYTSLKLNVHNYFFAKALAKLRPGGVLCFITSSGTMDNNTDGRSLRALLADRADFLGAIRLPNTAFKSNAGTEVTTDVIFLRKLAEGEKHGKEHNAWLKSVPSGIVDSDGRELSINEYYKAHPEMVIGKLAPDKLYGGGSRLAADGRGLDVGAELAERIRKLPKNIYKEDRSTRNSDTAESLKTAIAEAGTRDYAIVKNEDGSMYQYDAEKEKLVRMPETRQAIARAYADVRSAVQDILQLQIDMNATEEQLQKARDVLNRAYDSFVKKYGHVNGKRAQQAVGTDPNYGLVCSIEKYRYDAQTKTETASKQAIFTRRTVNPGVEVTRADNAEDALILSETTTGGVDMEYIAGLLDTTPEDAARQLGNRVYADPALNRYVSRDEYLSGNVVEKLELAEAAAKKDPKYKANVEALRDVQPKQLKPADIYAELGAPWIPTGDLQDFADELLGKDKGTHAISISRNAVTGAWTVEPRFWEAKSGVRSTRAWGTPHKNFPTLLEHALNQKSPKVTITDRTGRTVTLEKETLQAQGKLKEIQEKFRAWLWEDAERATRLTNFYNRNYNNWRLRDYDGEAEGLTFPGYSITEPQLRGHQKAGVWRIMHGNTLLAHCVGAGKTWTMQAAAMKMKQLGIANKSLFVVPNNVVAQFEKEFYQIYPNAKLLVLDSKTLPAVSPARTKEMTEKEYNEKKQQQYAKRMRALTSIATEDWDGIIISHDLFKRIPLSQENTKAFIQKQIDALEKALIDARMNAGKGTNSRFIKDLEKAKSNLEARLEKLINEDAKDIGIPFEQLGIDQIFVDEADLFKNLYFFTSMQNISGLSNNGSQRSTDLYMKTRYLSERYGGRGICFATATPVSNTMAELYTMMRYLDRKGLEEKGLGNFDAWAAAFARHEETVQLSPDKSGTGFKTVEAFTSFVNMPELITMFRKFADVRTREDLPELEVPKLRGGKAITVDIEPSAALSKYIRETIAKRADAIHNRSVNPKDDNMLKLTNDLRKASLDMRLVDPSLTAATEGGKIAAVADRVYDEYKNSRDVNGAQLIFCDMSIPKENRPSGKAGAGEETEGAAADEFAAEGADNVSVYVEIKEELVRRGIPADRIAFVHDAKNKKQKDALFTRVRNGEIAVIIGSTSKMGAGTNFQDHLVALHHVDAPWRPRDIEQREGRIIRQGNQNREVAIYNYVTRDSYDANMWEKLKNKAFMISQAMSGDLSARTLEDIGANVISFAEVQALASGDPLMAEKVKVDMDYRRLAAMKAGYDNSRYDMKDSILRLERAVTHWQEEKKKAEADRANAVDTSGDNFSITIMDKTYTDRAKADEELNKLADEWQRKLFGHERGAQVVIGKIGNRTILARNDGGVHLGFYVVGENEYPAKWSCASIEYQAAKAPGQVIANNIASIASAKKQMEAMRNELKKGFARQDELDRVTQRRKEIEGELERRAGKKEQDNKTKEAARGESEGGLNNAEKAGTKYSIIAASSTGENINRIVQRTEAELEKEADDVLGKYAVNREKLENGDILYTMPGGVKLQFSIRDRLIIKNPQNLKEEKSKHGIAEDTAAEDVIVPGCFNIVDERGKVGHISLATLGVNGSAYHEIFHAVWDMLPLTQKERDAINAKARERIAKQAEGKKESVDEARAELAREWFLTRSERRGTFAGRIGQMIHDLITRLTHWYRGVENYNDVMRRVESGEVWKRAAEDEAYAGATPLQMFTDRLAYMTIGAKGKGRSKAEKAERDRARKLAEKMEKQGLAPEAIYYATGWFKLADGKWHYEIASNFEGIDLMPLLAKGDGGRITVSDIYDNEQLYAEYPELADVEVRVEAMTDSADESKADTDTIAYARGNTIVFNANALNAKNISDPDTKTTVIHELEHIIQHKEGFGLGGSDVGIREDLQQTVKDYRREAKRLLGSAGRLYGKYRRAAAALNEARNRLYELTVLDPQELRKQESKVETATIALEKAKEELLKRVSASALGRANRLNELADGLESTVGQIEKKVEKELREEASAELGKDAAEADIRRWVGERLPEAVSFALYQNLTGEQISRMDEARAIRYYGRSEEAIRSLENRAAAARAQIESLVRGRNTARLFHNLMDAADMHIGATMGGSDADIERTGAALDKALDRIDATDAERNMIESALDAYSLVKEQAAFMKDMPTLEDAELALNIYRNLDDAATSAKKSGKGSDAESDGADGIDYSARLSIGFTPGTDVKYSLVAATTNLAKKIAGKGKEQNARIRVADTKYRSRMSLRDVLRSPHKIAKKFPVFKPFFEMGAVAMRRQEQLRSKYGRTMARIDNMLTGNAIDGIMNSAKRKLVRYGEAYRANKAAWHALMLEGDASEKEFTRGELEERSIAEPVIRAYLTTRQAVRNIYEQVNRARKKVRRHQTTMTKGELDNFMAKTAPFAENLKVTRKETGDFLVTYDAPRVWSSEETVSAETLADMRANAVHDETVTDADGTTTKVKRGNYLITNVEEIQDADGNVKYRVEYSMSVPDVHQLKGYIPHFFHDYLVTYRNADGVRVTVGSGRTVSEAREAAEKYLGSNKEAGEDGILIVPKTFDFGGEAEGMRRIIIGDTEMEAITRNIAEQMGFTLADARRQARQMGLGRSSKERYFGNLHHRNGAKGWESEDLDWALSHYFNAASRYIALEEFKNAAVSMFERRFGRFDARYPDTIANFVQNYIKDVNGDPTYLEKLVTDEIMRSDFWRKYIVSNFGERAALHFAGTVTGAMSIMKLGFFNNSSALLNLSQLVNTMGLLGDPLLVGKAMARALHPGVKERKLYEATGLLYDIGLDASGGGYGKFRAGKALYSGLEKTMYLFRKMDALARQVTVIAAYEQAIKEGKEKKNAIAFAEEINRKANFDYSVADAPDLFRRTGVIGQVMFQFMKYPIKEMELIAELADDLRQNRPGAIRRNVSFWTPFFLMSGIFGFPAADWFDEMFKTLFDFSLINKIKRRLIEWSAGDPEKTMVANLAMYGVGSLANINVSRRAGLGDLNPSSVPDSISEFFGPTGSTIANAFKGLGQFAQTGDIMPTVRALSPQLANYYNAVVGYGTGKRGRQTTRYEEMYDRLVKGMGFQTVTEARENDIKKIINEQKTRRKSGRETAIDAALSKQERCERLTRDDIDRLREYGVSSRDLAAERRKKRMTNIERTRSNLTKKEKKEFGALTGALDK